MFGNDFLLPDFVGVSVEYFVKGVTELLVLGFHSGFRVSRSERMTSEGALLKDSVCVDLFRKFVKASDYPIEGWRLAVKHSVCNPGYTFPPGFIPGRRRKYGIALSKAVSPYRTQRGIGRGVSASALDR